MKNFFCCLRSSKEEEVAQERPGPSAQRENQPLPAFIQRVNFGDNGMVQVLEFKAVGVGGVQANSDVQQSGFQSVTFGTVSQGDDVRVGASPVELSNPPAAIQFPMRQSLSNQNQTGPQVPTKLMKFSSQFNLSGETGSGGSRI